ncbi:low molecular weight protein-tyrosine-phosphatase [Weissella kandleri]|uniref:low molecular weight protein-tyrosine-phosphatase n=1 Tax=Weissella kandleri TaxID=1616 RepID=UPI00387E7D8F
MKVLFVCLGNIARSTMAEALFTQMVADEGLSAQIKIDSAGTSDEERGNPPHPGTQKVLRELNVPFDWIHARQIQVEDFKTADWIITMDHQNMATLKQRCPAQLQTKIHLAYEILPDKQDQEIPDPWYTQRFDITYQQLMEVLPMWLQFFKNKLA